MIQEDSLPYFCEGLENNSMPQQVNHAEVLQLIQSMATIQEGKLYKMLSHDWKAQLDSQVRDWMNSTRKQFIKQQHIQAMTKQYTQFDNPSNDCLTTNTEIDDYFQL